MYFVSYLHNTSKGTSPQPGACPKPQLNIVEVALSSISIYCPWVTPRAHNLYSNSIFFPLIGLASEPKAIVWAFEYLQLSLLRNHFQVSATSVYCMSVTECRRVMTGYRSIKGSCTNHLLCVTSTLSGTCNGYCSMPQSYSSGKLMSLHGTPAVKTQPGYWCDPHTPGTHKGDGLSHIDDLSWWMSRSKKCKPEANRRLVGFWTERPIRGMRVTHPQGLPNLLASCRS